MIKTEEVRPYAKNSKKHPEKQLKQIAESIKRFGFRQPIVLDKDNVIIAGHGRFKASVEYLDFKELKEASQAQIGASFIPYVKVEDLNPDEVKAYRLADNKLAESDWDMELAIEELKELPDDLVELSGFDKDLLIMPDEKDDEVPDVPEEPKAKLGDIYQLGSHRSMCGDSTKIEDVERLMDGKKADMYLSDPPYNVDYTGKIKDALKIENDKKEDSEFRQFLTDAIASVDAVMKSGAVFYIWHADLEGYNFRGACKDNGWVVRQCLVWNKNNMVMGRQDYRWKHEPCLYGWKDGAGHLWNSDRRQTTILNFDRPSRSSEHPTMKPVDLLAYQVQNNTKGEDIVLDTFLGSGSTLIACEKTGRVCYSMELAEKYVDVSIKRWMEFTGKTAYLISDAENGRLKEPVSFAELSSER